MDALHEGYATLCELLLSLASNIQKKVDCRNETSSILKKLVELEFAIILIFWKTFLERLDQTNVSFQTSTLNLNVMVSLLESLIGSIEAQRTEFEHYQRRGIILYGHEQYNSVLKRVRVPNNR